VLSTGNIPHWRWNLNIECGRQRQGPDTTRHDTTRHLGATSAVTFCSSASASADRYRAAEGDNHMTDTKPIQQFRHIKPTNLRLAWSGVDARPGVAVDGQTASRLHGFTA
jgi:hypothetical protein